MNPVFTGRIEKGKVILDNPNRYLVQISRLEGQRIEAVLRKQKSQRSINQNNYYFGVVIELLSDHTGYEKDEMHEALKEKFLSSEIDEHGLRKIKSTTKLKTTEMEDYLERIRRWAATELNCYVPLPNEVEAA
jgi:hypothetical protein